MADLKILCIGDIMLDVTVLLNRPIVEGLETRAKISTQGGGAAANVASWLAHNKTAAYLVTRIGDDSAGQTLLSELDAYGVEHSNIVIPNTNTGVVVVIVGVEGERTMFPDSGANSGLGLSDLPELSQFSAVYLSAYSLINSKSRAGVLEIISALRGANLPIILDPATVGVLMEVGVGAANEWLNFIDAIILNEEESHFLTGCENPIDAAAELLKKVKTVVIKRGSNGALGQNRGGQLIQVQARPTTVINTTGAGDAFAAGFISIWANNGELLDALDSGSELAAKCVALVGARPS
ncbi:RbsK Sugar kinases, ribokinase family [actinobacterium SCGC AAA044-D11]